MGKCAWCDSQFRVVNKLAAGGYISVGSRGVNNKKPVAISPMMWNLETQNMAEGGEIDKKNNEGKIGMMKARMALDAHFGNPAAKRMVSANPKTGMTPEGIGTHYMTSMGNYAVPLLQDFGDVNLRLVDGMTPSKEDMRFESPEDAEYFAKHYKEIAPMMKNFKEYKYGGILIKPENRGKFTAAAERRDMGVQEFASKVLANKEDYSSTMVKRANFAKNAASWKKAEGGMVDGGPGDGKKPAYSWSSQTATQPQLQIPSIVPDYTMADQLRFEEEKGKQREKKDEKANRELGKFLESNIPGMNNMIPEDAKKWMFNNIRPIDYPSIEGGIKAITAGLMGKGGAPPEMDAEGNYSIEEEAWAKALGLNIPSKYIIPSEYKPTKAKDQNSSYYKLRPDIIDPALILDEAKNLGLKEGDKVEISSLAPFVNENFMDPEAFSGIDPLQGFQISVGRDEKGKYVAIYDKYDFEGPLNSLIKPYEFYDRFYFPNQGNKQKNNSGMQVVQKKSYGGEVLFPEMFSALGDPKNLHLHDGIYAPSMGVPMNKKAKINRQNQFVGPPEFKYTYGSGGLVHLLNYYPGMGL